jgi:hypothetical protein
VYIRVVSVLCATIYRCSSFPLAQSILSLHCMAFIFKSIRVYENKSISRPMVFTRFLRAKIMIVLFVFVSTTGQM